ncbi:conjugal transfer protein TraG N-terminal domain-containing protein [Candidatus Velamenicoccus archaeovorus]|nr:conjugal transfer protein TraG N-terminal domain-containing protein [Candidatus Velamenicoccus archaeovorus]
MGISPTEAAFEVVGLVNAKSIMDYLFINTKTGAAVFLIGLLFSLWTAVKEADYSCLWGYVFMYFALLFIFIKPMANIANATSTMEQAGWNESTTQQILQNTFIDTGKTQAGSLGLVFISQVYDSVVYGTVSAITQVTQQQDFNYLNNPFIVNKVSLYLGHFSARGITKDPVLRKDMEDFLKNDYPQALGRMLNNSNAQTQITKKWWPGDEDVVANYDSAQRKRWENLDSRLNDYIKKQIDTWGLAGTFVNLFVDYKALKISLLSSEIGKSAAQIASGEAGYGINPQGISLSLLARKATGAFAFLGSTVGQFFSSSLAEFMIKALPYLEGYAVMIIYSLFPFTLLLCLLFRTPEILKEYFIYLFWVKSWVIIWALIHYASLYMAALQAKLASGTTSSWFFERPYFNTVTGVLLVMSPGIAWFMTKGVLTGIGEAASALTVHADKGTGKVSSKLGV